MQEFCLGDIYGQKEQEYIEKKSFIVDFKAIFGRY